MRFLWLAALCLLACDEELEVAAESKAAPTTASAPTEVAAASVLSLPGEIYKRALEQARRDINLDNAGERLKALEREIELDRQREP